jgi:hypothetical protein
MIERLSENDVAMLLNALFEFFLQETTAMLIFTHGRDLSN